MPRSGQAVVPGPSRWDTRVIMTIDDCRRSYSQEIKFARNIRSPAVIDAFARVPREKFLSPGQWEVASEEARALAVAGGIQMSYTPVSDPRDLYHNVVVVLEKGEDINNGQPSAVAFEAAALKPGQRAYHLGGGIGCDTSQDKIGENEETTGVEIMDGPKQSGYRLPRIDHLLDKLT